MLVVALFARYIAPRLSTFTITGTLTLIPRNSNSDFKKGISVATSKTAQYSASVLDKLTLWFTLGLTGRSGSAMRDWPAPLHRPIAGLCGGHHDHPPVSRQIARLCQSAAGCRRNPAPLCGRSALDGICGRRAAPAGVRARNCLSTRSFNTLIPCHTREPRTERPATLPTIGRSPGAFSFLSLRPESGARRPRAGRKMPSRIPIVNRVDHQERQWPSSSPTSKLAVS